MGDWNLGSVHDEVLTLVEGIPASFSGATLLRMADQKRQFVANWTGATIGSNSIDINFQDPITKLTAAATLSYMQIIGADVSSVKLGDFSEKKGADSNLMSSADALTKMAMEELKAYGKDIKFFKALG